MSQKIAVLVLAFNRPDHVAQSLAAIRDYRPDRLYLACDGARPHKDNELQMVQQTRQTMLDSVDWPCQVNTRFREQNLGCAHAVNDAISWFFEHEEYGIIVEDDIVIGPDFFRMCEDLLVRYKDTERIMEISARNESYRTDIPNTYVYSQCYHCWGWATWRRAWQKMDMSMSAVPHLSIVTLIRQLGWFRGAMMYYYFHKAYRHLDSFNSWATRWFLSILVHNGLVLCPGVNLALNIGMAEGTHYEAGSEDLFAGLTMGSLQWPIVYNDRLETDPVQRAADNRVFARMRYSGIKKKFRRIIP